MMEMLVAISGRFGDGGHETGPRSLGTRAAPFLHHSENETTVWGHRRTHRLAPNGGPELILLRVAAKGPRKVSRADR
jgi:hypothetical protein